MQNGRSEGGGEPECLQVLNFKEGFKTNVQKDVAFADWIKSRHCVSIADMISAYP